jgi:hypothetical protein
MRSSRIPPTGGDAATVATLFSSAAAPRLFYETLLPVATLFSSAAAPRLF